MIAREEQQIPAQPVLRQRRTGADRGALPVKNAACRYVQEGFADLCGAANEVGIVVIEKITLVHCPHSAKNVGTDQQTATRGVRDCN